MTKVKTVAEVAYVAIQAIETAPPWRSMAVTLAWRELLARIEDRYLPRGSGFDAGCRFINAGATASTGKLYIGAPYHAMDENGFYDGWRDVIVEIESRFDGPMINVTVQNNEYPNFLDYHGDYISELFHDVMTAECEEEFRMPTNVETD